MCACDRGAVEAGAWLKCSLASGRTVFDLPHRILCAVASVQAADVIAQLADRGLREGKKASKKDRKKRKTDRKNESKKDRKKKKINK